MSLQEDVHFASDAKSRSLAPENVRAAFMSLSGPLFPSDVFGGSQSPSSSRPPEKGPSYCSKHTSLSSSVTCLLVPKLSGARWPPSPKSAPIVPETSVPEKSMAMAVSYLFRGRSRVTKVPMWLSSSSSKSCVSKKSKGTCPVEQLPMWLSFCPPNRVLLQGQR